MHFVCCISRVTLASQSPGVVIVVDTFAVVSAIFVTVQQLLVVARGLAPSPFTLNSLNQDEKEVKKNSPEPSLHRSPPQWHTTSSGSLP